MLALLVSLGTRYACHVDNRGDQICLLYSLYGNDIGFVRDQVCLQSFLIGTRYACHNFKNENPFSVKHACFRSNLIEP